MSDARGRVWDHAPDGRELVAPERAVGTGRATTLGRDDKHRQPSEQPSRTPTRAARPRWLVAAALGALLAVLLAAVAVVALGGGDEEPTVVADGPAPAVATTVLAPGATVAAGASAATTTSTVAPAGVPGDAFAGTWSIAHSNPRTTGLAGIMQGSTMALEADGWKVDTPDGTTYRNGALFGGFTRVLAETGTGRVTCSPACVATFPVVGGAELGDGGLRFKGMNDFVAGKVAGCGLTPAERTGIAVVDGQDATASPARVTAFHYTVTIGGWVDTDGTCDGAYLVTYDAVATRAS